MGPIDIVHVPGWVSHVELERDAPTFHYQVRRVEQFGRLIRFDKRGTGLSDRDVGMPSHEAVASQVRRRRRHSVFAMGVAADLGYVYRPPGAFRRAMQAVAGTRPGAWFFSKTIESMDRVCRKVTNGRRTVTQLLAGLPVIYVTTTGRNSGEQRTHPLVAVPFRDTLAIIGSNFGGERTPAWAFNLEAEPRAQVQYGEAERDVAARPATDEERAIIWKEATIVYPGYDKYQQRITGREIRIFVMEPR